MMIVSLSSGNRGRNAWNMLCGDIIIDLIGLTGNKRAECDEKGDDNWATRF